MEKAKFQKLLGGEAGWKGKVLKLKEAKIWGVLKYRERVHVYEIYSYMCLYIYLYIFVAKRLCVYKLILW